MSAASGGECDPQGFIRNKSRFSQDISNQIDRRYRNMAKSV
jgi:hypothetical protein